MKKLLALLLSLMLVFNFAACTQKAADPTVVAPPVEEPTVEEPAATEETATEEPVVEETHEPVTLMVAAAASLENAYIGDLIPAFQAKYDWITVEGTYDSSGKLQTQIEEGLEADVFMSAAVKQMNALKEEALIDADSVVELLENKIVLIEPASAPSGITSFKDVLNADIIAVGDPESVPAGQYAQEAFTSLGIWDDVVAKASLGTNVTEVLNWVGEGSADVGVVYATDAASTDSVVVIAEAPEGSLAKKVIYPVGIVSASDDKETAQLFIDFLKSPEGIAIFEQYGFVSNQ
ncbi:MAG: molybdate ABC transporter substrate-binding protein [Anaerolineae bacterium]|jgi:molybdate transport system substrate-binding protein|nr:molybdate ABC transporter substrate-binding protein [Anaerolineae bacterium]